MTAEVTILSTDIPKNKNLLFASSKFQSLIVPLAAPAATNTSEESKLTESIPLE